MDFLQIQNGAVVRENGEPIRLRGTNIGAWMNMENFMNGMPGSEHRMRETARQTLGEEMEERGVVLRGCGNYPGLDDTWYRTAVRTREENDILLQTLREVLG